MLDIALLMVLCGIACFALLLKIITLLNLTGIWVGLRVVKFVLSTFILKVLFTKLKLILLGTIKTKLFPIIIGFAMRIIMPVKQNYDTCMPSWISRCVLCCLKPFCVVWNVVKSVFWIFWIRILYTYFLCFAIPWCCVMYLALWCAAILQLLRIASDCTGSSVLSTAARGYLYLARKILSIEWNVVGKLPQKPVVIACNHQSMIDAAVILACLPRTVVVFRRSLLWATGLPCALVFVGMIPVYDCNLGLLETLSFVYGKTDLHWLQRIQTTHCNKHICIFPEGCRVAPHEAPHTKYYSGVTVIARTLGREIAPAVINSGVVWGKKLTPHVAQNKQLTLKFLDLCDCNAELKEIEQAIKSRLQIC